MSPAKKVIAIEKDKRCLPSLHELEVLSEGRLEIIEGDALEINCAALSKGPKSIVANLPYNIATELLLGWLHTIHDYQSLTLMFQSEVVDRLTAKPHSKSYGRLSVITQFCCDAKRVMDIPARAFTPPPKVNSAVIHLTPRTTRPADVVLKKLETITKAAFGQRRKMLRSSLKSLGGENLLQNASLNPELRAEDLTLADFERLARLIH
jgi:16S rRNA (adenine1518-N6/adenine1519-N6)-dimethyltransferase